VFGLFFLLGYQFSPRLADLGGRRFWRLPSRLRGAQRLGLSSHQHRAHLRQLGGPAPSGRPTQPAPRAGARGTYSRPALEGRRFDGHFDHRQMACSFTYTLRPSRSGRAPAHAADGLAALLDEGDISALNSGMGD